MRFRELVETPTDETERRGRRQWGFAAPASEGAGPTTAALLDGRECRDRDWWSCVSDGLPPRNRQVMGAVVQHLIGRRLEHE